MGTQSPLNSCVISSICAVILLATLRVFSAWFSSTPQNTVIGGFVGSWLFILTLTSVSNVESVVFGSNFQARLFPEIAFSLIIAVIASGVVHRVCATTCILFSLVALYFLNKISQNYHNATVVSEPITSRKAGGRKAK